MIVCLNRNQRALRVDRDFERYMSGSIELEYNRLKAKYDKLSREVTKGKPGLTDIERQYRELSRRHDSLLTKFQKIQQLLLVAG